MNPRVLPVSCRQSNRRKALPARCRQHLGSGSRRVGDVGDRRSGSGETVERVTTILKEPFHLAPLFLGRSSESSRETESGL